MIKLNRRQENIINFVQGDLPVCENPYAAIAKKLKISETEIVQEIKTLKKLKFLRRFGALLNHRKIGLKVNCMCVWSVKTLELRQIADIAKNTKQISHCYIREKPRDWPYNFYTMLHCRSKTECLKLVKNISLKTKVNNYKMLFTKEEFKKTSTKYPVALGRKQQAASLKKIKKG